LNPDMFHIYNDREFFSYQIDLTRNDLDNGEPGQRYTLCVSLRLPKLGYCSLTLLALGIRCEASSVLVHCKIPQETRRYSAQLPPTQSLLGEMERRNALLQ
jgi:hypothetical protein